MLEHGWSLESSVGLVSPRVLFLWIYALVCPCPDARIDGGDSWDDGSTLAGLGH